MYDFEHIAESLCSSFSFAVKHKNWSCWLPGEHLTQWLVLMVVVVVVMMVVVMVVLSIVFCYRHLS